MAYVTSVPLPLQVKAKLHVSHGISGILAGTACAASFGFITLMLFSL